MILQELVKFYNRKSAEPDSDMPRPGFSKQAVDFTLVIDNQGNLLTVRPEEWLDGKKKKRREFEGPTPPLGRTSGIKAGFILDKLKYILGAHPLINFPKHAESHRLKVEQCFKDTQDEGMQSYLLFLDKIAANQIDENILGNFVTDSGSNPTLSIQRQEDVTTGYPFLWLRPLVLTWYMQSLEGESEDAGSTKLGQCLLSGKSHVRLQILHGGLSPKLIGNENKAGLVAFNKDKPAFNSYKKEQSYNAPTSQESEQAYVAALQYLYKQDSPHRLRLSGTTLAFWAEHQTEFEAVVKGYFDDDDDEPAESKQAQVVSNAENEAVKNLHGLYQAPNTGYLNLERYTTEQNEHTRFFVLGLSPNSARLSVRFWYQGSVTQTAQRLKQHLDDLEIIKHSWDKAHIGLKDLLRTTAFRETKFDIKHVNPRLEGELILSILNGTPYPQFVMQNIIQRVKADIKKPWRFEYCRMGLLKACLNRKARYYSDNHFTEIGVAMDEHNTSTAYRLGRLFALLENLQYASSQNLNSSIADRYFTAASTNPQHIFVQLLRLAQHHLKKLNPGLENWYKQEISSLLEPVSSMPLLFSLDEQGQFILGYYHQRLTKKKEQLEQNH